ncbi:MAG: alpha/beta fold hydrolase [Bacteroidales bacterium]|nr:MAG: alpha/beta fold hydrolase [Bacteroidales bacterium]
MKNMILLCCLIFILGCNPKEKKTRVVEQYTIEQFYANTNVFGGSFSADETYLLVTSNETGIYNAFTIPVEGGDPVQLTLSDEESIFATSYFPEDDRILYSSDRGGNEISHIYVRNEDGSTEDLTPVEGAISNFGGWTRDNRSFYFISNQRDRRYFDLYLMDIETMEGRMVYENKEGLNVNSISADNRYLALVKPITTSNNEMYLFDLETEELKHISEHEGDATYSPQDFSLDNKMLYFLTDEGNEFTYLMTYNLETGEKGKIMETDWDIWYAYHSFNEKYRVVGINEDARTVIKIFDLELNEEVGFPEFEDGDITSVSISKSEKLMRFTVGSSKSPSNIFIYNFETGDYKQLTNTLNPEINPDDLVAGRVVRYPSFDGLEIPAILYKPHQAAENNKVPALVWVHGGPGGQSRLGFSSRVQFLVNHGYAIIAVNNRGSTGYGKTFYKMDDQRHGEVDLQDCIKANDFLATLGYIDTTKIGIIGGSYGGYMVMAALAFEPEAFAVGVNVYGVTNWLRTLKSIPAWWEAQREALYTEMGDPYSADSVRLYRISPLFHAGNVTKPVMVLQGANDPRVLQVESDEMVEAIRQNGIPVEYVLFEDEGHGFVKRENEIEGYGGILVFLDRYLKGEE